MGSGNSKHRVSDIVDESNDDSDGYFVKLELDNDTKRAEIEKLRDEYRNNIQLFLLNQVLYSVMFFKNYEQELIDMSPNETNISVKELSLTDDLFLTCIQPDEVLTLVNNHVYFCARHGPNKNKQSPLVMNRVFVIHESIQVVTDADYHYANIDKPSLTAQVVEINKKGFVRLKYIETLKFKNSNSSNTSSTVTSDDASYDGKSDDTYGRITEARTIKPMDETQVRNALHQITCEKRKNNDATGEHDFYIKEYFVNSQAVKEQFYLKWHNIAQLLELDDEDIAKAGSNCDSIFCYSKRSKTMWEIIPAVQLPRGAYEKFITAKTIAIKEHLARNKKKVFPNEQMLKRIVNMDRLAIARGYMSKYDIKPNKYYQLEWELAHPKVEKYLQHWLTHTHMRVLLLMLLIHKSYIEPKTDTQGVNLRHLVTHLFWELQKDVVISETRMGTRLLQMIDSFCKKLGKKVLADYFIEEHNHFENIPFDKLLWAQKIFSRTKEKPLMNFMSALLNMQYKHEAYPEFDIKKLYNILTTKKVLNLGRKTERKTIKQDWATIRRTVIMKQKQMQKPENLTAQRKVSVDSIDISIVVNEITKAEDEFLHRSRKILIFFLDHYIKMALSCNRLGNTKQAHSYLQQAELLTYLFHVSCTTDAQEYRDKIRKHRKTIIEGSVSEDPSYMVPTLPNRTSVRTTVNFMPINSKSNSTENLNKKTQQNGAPRAGQFRKQLGSESSTKDDSAIIILRNKNKDKVPRKSKSVNFSEFVIRDQNKESDKIVFRPTKVNLNTENYELTDSNDKKEKSKQEEVQKDIVTARRVSSRKTKEEEFESSSSSDDSNEIKISRLTDTETTEVFASSSNDQVEISHQDEDINDIKISRSSDEDESDIEDLDGLDEINTESEDEKPINKKKNKTIDSYQLDMNSEDELDTITEITNPFDFKKKKLNLQHDADDSFT